MNIVKSDMDAMHSLMFESYGPNSDDNMTIIEIEPSEPVITQEFDNTLLTIELKKIVEYASRLLEDCQSIEFEPWMIAKVVKSSDYVSDVYYSVSTEVDFANSGVDTITDNIF